MTTTQASSNRIESAPHLWGTPGKMPSAEVARKSMKKQQALSIGIWRGRFDGTAKQIFDLTLLDAVCRFLPKRCGSQSLLEKRPQYQQCPWTQGCRRKNQRTEFSNSQAAFARENQPESTLSQSETFHGVKPEKKGGRIWKVNWIPCEFSWWHASFVKMISYASLIAIETSLENFQTAY